MVDPNTPNRRTPFTQESRLSKTLLIPLWILAGSVTLYFVAQSRELLLPIIVAILLTLIFGPAAGWLQRKLRAPRFLAALVIVLGLGGAIYGAAYTLTDPITRYFEQFQTDSAKAKLAELFAPIRDVQGDITDLVEEVQSMPEIDPEVAKEGEETSVTIIPGVEETPENGDNEDGGEFNNGLPLTVSIEEDVVDTISVTAQEVGITLVTTLFLFFFLLAYGDLLTSKIAIEYGNEELLNAVKTDVSGYLFLITFINFCLGVCIGVGLFLLGVEDAPLWGLMAMFLNFIPYAGAVLGALVVVTTTAVTSGSVTTAAYAGAIYFGLSSIEGNMVTPAVIGRKFSINPIVVFTWVCVWAALWGLPGMLIGLPLLMMFRIICAQVPGLSKIERIISV